MHLVGDFRSRASNKRERSALRAPAERAGRFRHGIVPLLLQLGRCWLRPGQAAEAAANAHLGSLHLCRCPPAEAAAILAEALHQRIDTVRGQWGPAAFLAGASRLHVQAQQLAAGACPWFLAHAPAAVALFRWCRWAPARRPMRLGRRTRRPRGAARARRWTPASGRSRRALAQVGRGERRGRGQRPVGMNSGAQVAPAGGACVVRHARWVRISHAAATLCAAGNSAAGAAQPGQPDIVAEAVVN